MTVARVQALLLVARHYRGITRDIAEHDRSESRVGLLAGVSDEVGNCFRSLSAMTERRRFYYGCPAGATGQPARVFQPFNSSSGALAFSDGRGG